MAIGRLDNLYQLWGILVLAGLGIGGIVVPASIITTIICPDVSLRHDDVQPEPITDLDRISLLPFQHSPCQFALSAVASATASTTTSSFPSSSHWPSTTSAAQW